MSSHSFDQLWRADLAAGTLGVQLAEVDHPLEIYVGASDLGNARMQVRSKERPNVPRLSDVVVVDRTQLGDTWLLSFTLQDTRFLDVFISLAVHVVDRTRSAATEAKALEILDVLLDQWRRLMTPAPIRRLNIDSLRGLVGELWYLINHCATDRSFDQALSGWNGPLGLPQDFWYVETGFHEVKSVGPGARALKITSAEQLDEEELELIVLVVPQVPDDTGGAVALAQLVQLARSELETLAAGVDALDLRMKRMGVDLSDPYYAETCFEVRAMSTYPVSPEFPAIRASGLSTGIERVRYQLGLTAIEPFKAGTLDLA